MTSFVTLVVFVSSAPGAPANFSDTVIAASKSQGPRVNLTWNRPQQENGIIRSYNLVYSNNEDQERVHTQTFGSNTFTYSVDVLGGLTYQFYVRAVTNKPGTNATLTVAIPEYGKGMFFVFVLEFGNVGFCGGTKTGEPGENPRSKEENQQQTQPTYDTGTGNWTRATLVEGE